jgi:hypothetical protein
MDNKIKIMNSNDGIQKLTSNILNQVIKLQEYIDNTTKKINYNKEVLNNIKDNKLHSCCICSNDISIYGITKCYHFYCFDCIIQILKNNKKCAMCRLEINDINDITFFSRNNMSDTSINIKSLNINNNQEEYKEDSEDELIESNLEFDLSEFINNTFNFITIINIFLNTLNEEEKEKYKYLIKLLNEHIETLNKIHTDINQ